MNEEYPKDLQEKEEELSASDDFDETPPSDIVAFNELRSCADLVRMYEAKQLDIKPDFQRDLVWPKNGQTRFIDSLVKQLPIPSMCISLDYKTGKRLMIDGLQRMSSIISFLSDEEWKLSKLDDIDPRISGRTVRYIKDKLDDIYSRVENLTIPVTVLRCDYSKRPHMRYLFTIFHRLNTGGNKLNNQEIRNCIFQGSFNNMLKEIVSEKKFRELFALEAEKTYRFAYEELVLRVIAMESSYEHYQGRLAMFLNEYMDTNRKLPDEEIESSKSKLARVVSLLYERILEGSSLPKLSKTTTEAIFVGILRNIDSLEKMDSSDLQSRLSKLRNDDAFSVENLKGGLNHTDKVQGRLERAIEIFST